MKTIEEIFNHYAEHLRDSDDEFEGYFIDKEDFIKAFKEYTPEAIKADKEKIVELTKKAKMYEKAYHILICYFDSISDEEITDKDERNAVDTKIDLLHKIKSQLKPITPLIEDAQAIASVIGMNDKNTVEQHSAALSKYINTKQFEL